MSMPHHPNGDRAPSNDPELGELVRRTVGLRVREQDTEALSCWTQARGRALSLGTRRYGELLAEDSAAGRLERELLTVRFTTGESYFLRDAGQFELLESRILPELIERRAPQRRLRLWSAGCAAGEEAYTLAMLVDRLAPHLEGWKVSILGTDINTEALGQARAGSYGQWSFRALDEARKRDYFLRQGERWTIDARLRAMVEFRNVDLLHDGFPDQANGMDAFDLILCRNVFIYLDAAAIARISAKFAAALADGGYLLTGHSELFGHHTGSLRTRIFAQSVALQKLDEPESDAEPSVVAEVPAPAPQAPRRGRPPRAMPDKPAKPAAPTRNFEAWLRDAQRLADRGLAAEAGQACRSATALARFDPRPYYLLAQLAEERGDVAAARAMLKKVIYLDPVFIAAYLDLAALYRLDGDIDRAQRMLQAARRALGSLPEPAGVASCGDSAAGEVLAYVERLMAAAVLPGAADASGAATATPIR